MTTLPVGRLAALLRETARGAYATEAATELLITHERWLRRADFLAACVWIGTDTTVVEADQAGAHADDPLLRAGMDWETIPAFVETAPCSGSEDRILRLVAELAGHDTGTPLAELLTGLDETNSALVVAAIAHALRHPRTGGPGGPGRPREAGDVQ